jgi:hypothetical protein
LRQAQSYQRLGNRQEVMPPRQAMRKTVRLLLSDPEEETSRKREGTHHPAQGQQQAAQGDRTGYGKQARHRYRSFLLAVLY